MMSNYMQDAFAPIDAMNRATIARHTFGHLAPKPRQVYTGWIVFTYGSYGDYVVIDDGFDGLPDSPWFFEDMNEFICDKAERPGTVYRFDGTYTKFKNGAYRFSGKVTIVWVQP